jgi:dephospho-CoA kinase
MEIIGLTGSIGMGKSLAASMLKTLGFPVFDSDACVHSLLKGVAIKPIRKAFPSAWNKDSQSIDKVKLGELVFSNKQAKDTLELILHPLVWQAQQEFLSKCRRAGYKKVVLDIPLLFETGRDRICNRVICVTAPRFIQEQRVLRRKNMNRTKFNSILNSQMPDKSKQRHSDIVIPTGLGRRVTLNYLKRALQG